MSCPRCGNRGHVVQHSDDVPLTWLCKVCQCVFGEAEHQERIRHRVPAPTAMSNTLPWNRPSPATTKPQQWPVWPWRGGTVGIVYDHKTMTWPYTPLAYANDIQSQSADFVEAELRKAGWLD